MFVRNYLSFPLSQPYLTTFVEEYQDIALGMGITDYS